MELGDKFSMRLVAAIFAAVISFATAGLAAFPAGAAPIGNGSISGRVVDPGGNPLANICVTAAGAASTTTDPTGTYVLAGLATGAYDVQFSDCNPSPTFVTQWYLGHVDQGDADPVNVVDPFDTPLPDVTMQPGIAVSGTVTDTSGNPIANVSVNVNPTSPGQSAYGQSAPDGTYTTGVLPAGSYRVQFASPDPQFAREYWKDKPSWNSADTLVLDSSGGPVQGGVDAQLSLAATVAGTVTDTGGSPLPGICVDANVPNAFGNWDGVGHTQTLGDGTYSITGLPSVDVRVRFNDCSSGPHIEQWYSGQPDFNNSTPIVLSEGELRTGVDVQLATGTSVSGTVVDANGTPIPNVNINVNPTGSGPSAWAQTNPAGNYTTNGLPPGDYTVQFQGTGGFAGEYWNDRLSRNDADVLTISAGDGPVHGGVDAALAVGASLSGRVTDANGAPVANACVDATIDSSDGIDGVGGATTAPDGTYTITGLPPTTVKVVFRDCNGVGPYVQEWWDDQAGSDSATAIVLAPGEARTGVDAQLAAAGAITGTVTDGGGNPLAGICAQATTTTFVGGFATTDANGAYTIVLAKPGDYRVQFVDCSGAAAFAGEWWDGTASPATAQLIPVSAGQVVTGIDATLASGATGSISGKLVNARGAAMTTACVIAYVPNEFVIFAAVQPDGSYTVPNVPSGTYALAFLGCSSGEPSPIVADPDVGGVYYPAFWWETAPLAITDDGNGGPDPIAQGATLVTVAAGEDVTGYDGCFGCEAITITSITPGPSSLTTAFTPPDLTGAGLSAAAVSVSASVPITYTMTCTSPSGGVTGSASGPGSPITLTGLTPGASYACQVAAVTGSTLLATSAVLGATIAAITDDGNGGPGSSPSGATPTGSQGSGDSDPGNARGVSGSLPRTGASSPMALVRAGFLLLLVGTALACMSRSRRRPVAELP